MIVGQINQKSSSKRTALGRVEVRDPTLSYILLLNQLDRQQDTPFLKLWNFFL